MNPPVEETPQKDRKPRPVSVGSLELQSRDSAEQLHQTAVRSEQSRRYTFSGGSYTDSGESSVFGSDHTGSVKMASTTSAV